MLRPRILSSYNYKRQDADKKGKEDKVDKPQAIMSEVEKVRPNYAELKIDNNIAGNNQREQRQEFEMEVSVSEEVRQNVTIEFPLLESYLGRGKLESDQAFEVFHQDSSLFQQSVTCRSEKVVQTTTKRSINVVQLAPHSSSQVYELMPQSSDRVMQCVKNSSTKGGQLKNASSMRVEKLGQNSASSGRKLSVSHSSGRVVKLLPHSSTRLAHLVSNSSMRVTRLVENFPKTISSFVPPYSPTSSQLLTKVFTDGTQIQGNSPKTLSKLMSNTPAQTNKFLPTSSPKIGQTAPSSPKKVSSLVKFSSSKATGSTPNSSTSLTPRSLSKPSIKSIELLTKGDNNSNVVMVLPVCGKETKAIQSQTMRRLEKIQHWKDVTRVQQVIGVQRRHGTSENNFLADDITKLEIVAPEIVETKDEENVSEALCTNVEDRGDNIDSQEEMVETHDAPLSRETFEEEKVVVESEKSSDSTMSKNDLDTVEKTCSTDQEADTKETQSDVEVVHVEETANKPNNSRKRSRSSVLNRKKNEPKDTSNKTTRTTTGLRKSTIVNTRRRNNRSAARPNQAKPQISAFARMQDQLLNTLASMNFRARNKWQAQCIICKDQFTDKYEFHRHVTLAHPGIRIVFCELCNASFRTDIELKQHRYSYHKITVTKDAKNNLVKLEAPIKSIVDLEEESERPKPKTKKLEERRLQNRKKIVKEGSAQLEPMAGRSNENIRSNLMKKRVTASCMKTEKSKRNPQPNSVPIGPQRTKSQKEIKKSKYSYVDIDIIGHKAISTNETFVNAEMRKLIIPIVRIETNLDSAGANDDKNSLETTEKPTILSSRKKKFVNSGSNRVSKKCVRRATRFTVRKRRRAHCLKKTLEDDKKVAISQEPKVAQLDISNVENPVAPRRRLRSRKEKKSLECKSDENSNNGLGKIEQSDDGMESTINKEIEKPKEPVSSDNSRSSQNFTLIDVEDEPEVGEVVQEQRVIKKLVSRSSLSTCSSTFDDNCHQDDANIEVLKIHDVGMKPLCSPERKISGHKSLRSSKARNSTSSGSEEKLIVNKRATKAPRFSCLNLYDVDLSNNSDSRENRDRDTDEISKKHDRRAVVNKKIRDKRSIVRRRREKGDKRAKEKSDDENKLSEEKIDGEDNKEKNQSSGDGKNLDEKSTGDGKPNNGNSNGEEIYTKAKSSVIETLRKKQSDDEDEEPKKRINEKDKKPKEKIEDEDDEQDVKLKNEEKQFERKSLGENKKLGEKSKRKELSNKNESEPSNKGDDDKRSNNKNNVGVMARKEKEKSLETKTSTDLLESPAQKTYSSGKKLLKVSKQLKESEDKKEKSHELCAICKELCSLMKKVSNQVGDRNTTEIPIKCPLCQRYFITMFHLELHVATKHLQCQHEIPCKIAELPIVKKPSKDIGLDCETRIDMAIECLRCSMKFSTEKDLNDHLIAKHEICYPNDNSSNVYPEYIRDLRTSLLETKDEKNVVTGGKSDDIPNSASETHGNPMTPATLDCSLCDEKFVESTKYVRHVREMHNAAKTSSPNDRNTNSIKSLSNKDKLCSLSKEVSPKVLEGSSAQSVEKLEKAKEIEQADRVTSDRDYVLRQLLSDDSSNEDNDLESNARVSCSKSSLFKGPTKQSIVQKPKDKNVADSSSTCHSCEICQKKFKRVQDLLLHEVSHINGQTPMDHENGEKNGTKAKRKGRSGVFVQSDSGDDFKESGKMKYDEFSPMKDRVFVYHRKNERDNVAVLFGTNGASEKVVVGSKRQATLASYEMSENPKIEEKGIPIKKHKISSANPSRHASIEPTRAEPRDARKYAMKQLIETEVGLTDEINKKMPIACTKCNRHFANRSQLNEHLFFLHDDSLKDTVLTDVLTQIGGLRSSDENESSQRWNCEDCAQTFKLFQGYSRHKFFVHGDDSMVHVCGNCSKVMTNVTMVNVHICTDVASYNCHTCKETFPTGMSLRLHNTEKHMETIGPHTCEVCKDNFLTNGMLERHKNNKHRGVRTYRARKYSPVRLATADTTNQDDLDEPVKPDKHMDKDIDKAATKKNSREEEDSIMSCDPFALRRGRWRSCRSKKKVEEKEIPVAPKSPNLLGGQKRRGRPRKNSLPEEETSSKESQEANNEEERKKERPIVHRGSVLYIDETEIHQCGLCQLYCLSRSTLRNHMVKIHSATDEICQLCQKMYPTGKLIRHMIERHITSEDGEVLGPETSWRIGTNSNEIDAEILIKMLGIDRLVSLCEYRRYSEKNRLTSYPCVPCKKYFANHELYKYHFLLHHDAVCALCNIEFKTGHDAARHKSEIHGSVGRYIWFADRTITALTSTKNFTDATESMFMERITRDEKVANDGAEEIDEDEEQHSVDTNKVLLSKNVDKNSATISKEMIHGEGCNVKEGEDVTTNEEIGRRDEKLRLDLDTTGEIVRTSETTEKSIETTLNTPTNPVSMTSSEDETIIDNRSSASDDFISADDVHLIIVVTDDDLKKFNITTRHPNIWGLAAKISSTYEGITPKQVKDMLALHFEREEDFDT